MPDPTLSLDLLRLSGERALGVLRLRGGRRDAVAPPDDDARRALAELLARGNATHVAWCDEQLAPRLTNPARWPALLVHPLEVLHLSALLGSARTVGTFGLVDFDSPYLLAGPTDRRHATWLLSAEAGIGHRQALVAAGFDRRLPSFRSALLDLGYRGLRAGLCPYSEPRLGRGEEPETKQVPPLRGHEVAALVRRTLGRKWLLFWTLGSLLFARHLPLAAALRGAGAPSAPSVDEEILAALRPPLRDLPDEPVVDVLIPTLGRPRLLHDLLLSLAAQTLPPRLVVIVDQRPAGDMAPPLPDLPFAVSHHVVPWTGACRARNVGLDELARREGDWVLLLDDDVRLRPELIRYLLRVARTYGLEALNAAIHQPDEEASPGNTLPHLWPRFASGGALVSRRALGAVPHFDRQLEGGFGEDYEFGLRLGLAGFPVLQAPAEPILHLKALAGGFRSRFPHPWLEDAVPPRPSPTVLYSRRKHQPPFQQQGYELFYALKRLSAVPPWRWPAVLRRQRRQWQRAVYWCDRLLAGTAGAAAEPS